MQRTVAMPKLGMTMTEGVLVRWHVAPGDVVAADDVLADVETDKVELEVEAPFGGTIAEVLVPEGQTVPVGTPIVLLVTDVPSTRATVPVPSPAVAPERPAGAQRDHQGQRTLTADNPQHHPNAAPSGRIPSTPAARRIASERGVDIAAVADAAGRSIAAAPLRAADVLDFAERLPSATRNAPVLTPLARKIADEHDVGAAELAGRLAERPARRLGRQAVEEVLAARQEQTSKTRDLASTAVAEGERLTTVADGVNPLTSMRRTIAERTAHSFSTVPHIYLDIEADMTEAEQLRAARAASAEGRGEIVPTATAVLVRVVAAALARHPEVNAGYVPASAGQPAGIQRWRDVHIGLAVAMPDGLLVPVVHHADRKSLAEIAKEIVELSRRAREGQLRPDDLTGGTFTISNLGMFGIDTFHAVLNEPQAAILAVGRVQRRPVVIPAATPERETIAIRPVVKLSLSADHRVLDGAGGARFLQTLRELLEDPRLLV